MIWRKPAFFHSYSSSEAVLLSHFGKWCRDWEPDAGRGHRPLRARTEQRLCSPVCENELSWDQRNSQTNMLLFPASTDTFLFSPEVPRCLSWVHTGWDLQQLYNPGDLGWHLLHPGLVLTKLKSESAGEKWDGSISPWPLPHIMLWKTGTQNCRRAWRRAGPCWAGRISLALSPIWCKLIKLVIGHKFNKTDQTQTPDLSLFLPLLL